MALPGLPFKLRPLLQRSPSWFHRAWERIIEFFLSLSGFLSILLTTAIGWVLIEGSIKFFMFQNEEPLSIDSFSKSPHGILPLLVGTLLVTVIASLVAVPIGLLTAVYLSEYASPPLRAIARPTLELLGGIPTVLYGFFALMTVSPLLALFIPGLEVPNNQLSGGIVVGIMILPMVTALCEDALRAVPGALRDGSYALGANQFETSTRVVIPAARSGILASFILSLTRAVGETMAVSLACGSTARLTLDPREGAATLTSFIVGMARSDVRHGSSDYYSLSAVGALLFFLTLAMNAIASRVIRRNLTTSGGGSRGLYFPGLASGTAYFKKRLVGVGKLLGRFRLPRAFLDRAFARAGFVAAFLGLALLLVFFGQLVYQAGRWFDLRPETPPPALLWHFLTSGPDQPPQDAGIWPALLGSCWLGALTLFFAVPIGVAAALYLEEYRRTGWWARLIQANINHLAGVPSVVFGLLGAYVFIDLVFKPLEETNPGIAARNVLGGGLTLALLALPVIISASQKAIRAVPQSIRQGAQALGATKWQLIWYQVLPLARGGIFTGSLLSLSRALGEAAPLVLFGALTCGDREPGLFSSFTAMPLQIFDWAGGSPASQDVQAVEIRNTNAALASLFLLIGLLALHALAIYLRHRTQHRAKV